MQDRRQIDRKYLTYFSRVTNRGNGRLIGYLADLTTGGAMLIADTPIDVGTILRLRMDLPDGYSGRGHLDFNAKVVWNRPDQDPAFHKVGLQLVDIPYQDLAIIERVLNDYGFNG